MRRWLDMAASRQLARRIALDAGMHALAGLVDFMPRMKQRMRTCRLIEDLEYAHHGGEVLRLDILQPIGPGQGLVGAIQDACSGLPNPESCFSEQNSEFDFHVPGRLVSHRVVGLVKVGQQA